jgi:transposase-like protein
VHHTYIMQQVLTLCTFALQGQRLTPARKRSQMLLLVRDIAAAQASFNARVLALRGDKRSLLVWLNASRQRLSAINKLLGITGQ